MYNRDKKYDPDKDYSALADQLASEGRWGEAYDAIYGITDSRTTKIRDTGYDYGRTNENVWQDLINRYGGTDKQRYTSALEGMAADRYSPGANDARYEAAIKAAMGMNYNEFTRGADYEALQQRYERAGQRAMDDTLGKVSARTGGLASSYAGNAAQQTYNDYMTQLEDAARSLYESRRNEALKNAELARTAADRDYDRAIADRNYRASMYNDLAGYAYKNEALAYDRAADAEKKATTERDDARDRIYYMLAKTGGSLADIPADLIRQSGLTDAELAAYAREYANTAKANATPVKGAAGGEELNALFEAARTSGMNPKTYIKQHIYDDKYGFSKMTDDDMEEILNAYDEFVAGDGPGGAVTDDRLTYADVEQTLINMREMGLSLEEMEAAIDEAYKNEGVLTEEQYRRLLNEYATSHPLS